MDQGTWEGFRKMTIARIFTVAALSLTLAAPAFAQATQPVQNQPTTRPVPTAPAAPTAPAPVVQPTRPAATAPAAPTAPARAAAPQTQGQPVNLNTATAAELDKLPQIGDARAKAIVENRTKNGRFKDWNDFVARNVVPGNAEAAIKDKVRF
jgi:competence protein ComEA